MTTSDQPVKPSSEAFVKELIARIRKFDDKPHQLFSWLAVMVGHYDDDPVAEASSMELMNAAYCGITVKDVDKWLERERRLTSLDREAVSANINNQTLKEITVE